MKTDWEKLMEEHHALTGCTECPGPGVLKAQPHLDSRRVKTKESTSVERACYPVKNLRLCRYHLKKVQGLI